MSHTARYERLAKQFITFTICKNSDIVGQDFRASNTFSALTSSSHWVVQILLLLASFQMRVSLHPDNTL